MKKVILGLFVIVTAISTSCKKSDSCSTSVASLSGSYRLTASTYTEAGTTTPVDYFSLMEPCSKDNIFTLNSNGTYIITDAGSVCNPNEDDAGLWVVNGNTISIDGDPATIESFNCKTLVVTNSDQFGTYRVTYQKQ